MDKKQELSKLKKRLEQAKNMPLIKDPKDVVFGDGSPEAETMFIGEAAGYWESVERRPFVGRAGKLLDKLIKSIGMRREDVYISNIVKTRPPNNRDPLPAEVEAFRPYLDKEIEIIQPKVIVTLGRFSMAKFLPNEKISKIHGKPRQVTWRGRDVTVIPMYHPAAALRSGEVMRQIEEDFKVIPDVLKKIREQSEKPEQMNLI